MKEKEAKTNIGIYHHKLLKHFFLEANCFTALCYFLPFISITTATHASPPSWTSLECQRMFVSS